MTQKLTKTVRYRNSSVSLAVIPSFGGVSAFPSKVFWKVSTFFLNVCRQCLRKLKIIFFITKHKSFLSRPFALAYLASPRLENTWKCLLQNFWNILWRDITHDHINKVPHTLHLEQKILKFWLTRHEFLQWQSGEQLERYLFQTVSGRRPKVTISRKSANSWEHPDEQACWAPAGAQNMEHKPDQDVSRESLTGPWGTTAG